MLKSERRLESYPSRMFEAIVYMLRIGIQWKALPKSVHGSPSSIHACVQKWQQAEFFEAL